MEMGSVTHFVVSQILIVNRAIKTSQEMQRLVPLTRTGKPMISMRPTDIMVKEYTTASVGSKTQIVNEF